MENNDNRRHEEHRHTDADSRTAAASGRKVSAWLVIGVLFLIALLILWLTIASFTGDTDVAAFITPAALL